MALPTIFSDKTCDGVVHEGSFMTAPFRIRLTTHADYDDVMKIDENVYRGGDYLPSSYHDMVDNPRAYCFLAELDGEVMAFVCYWMDGFSNTMTTSTASRVNPKYRHRGLYVHFTELVELEMKKIYPSLLFDWSVSVVSESVIKRFELAGGRLIEKKLQVLCSMHRENIQGHKYLENVSGNVHTPNSSELTDLLNNKEVLNYLYPQGVFIHANIYKPFPASQHFIHNVLVKEPVIISGKLESRDLGLSTLNVRSCPMGVKLTVCYDGTPDERIVKAHILKATETMATLCTTVADEQHRKNKSTYEKECHGQSDKVPVRLSVLFSCAVDAISISNFIRETYHCEHPEDISTFGVFEKTYI
ncbi:hypothetical protein LSH36_1956g00006 [Paralvinella palmiformis]|uniref:N-acetyltransferase domain-containing protein n=1 Tax=Paralvinella palmiformis TaxID=53620 RepID=A0AAD9MPQ9_9ANNE|nr:hypothetical protein LSH36_1956g00006 [Paralvinella palmiformis]